MTDFISDDTNSAIRATLIRSNGEPFDLTGLSAVIRFRANNDPPIEHTMVITDAIKGVVQYTFLPGELIAGKLYVEFEVRA